MSTLTKLRNLFARGSNASADDQLRLQSGFDTDPTEHELHREESFKVEALEPRILLSADPLTGELARLVEDSGRYDPAAEVAALVQQLDAIEAAPEAAPEAEDAGLTADDEIVWPEEWLDGEGEADTSDALVDATEVAIPAASQTGDEAATDEPFVSLQQTPEADPEPVFASSVNSLVGQADAKGHDAQAPPVQISETQQNNAETENTPNGVFGAAGDALVYSGPLGAAIGTEIRQSDAQAMLGFVISEWRTALGDDTLFSDLTIAIADLSDGVLGNITGAQIILDVNAAGQGWFLDTTPESDEEFTTLCGATLVGDIAGVDLLTVIRHEVGHAAGFDHDAGFALMNETLGQGERRGIPAVLPAAGDPVSGNLSTPNDGTLTDTVGTNAYFYVVRADGTVAVYNSANFNNGSEVVVTTSVVTAINASDPSAALTEVDTLVLPDVAAVVNLDDVNAGSVTFGANTITFTSIESIQFGNTDDRLVIDDAGFITGEIDQGDGTFEISVADVISILFDEGTVPTATLSISVTETTATKVSTTGGADVANAALDLLAITLEGASVFVGTGANGYFADGTGSVGVEISGAAFTLNIYADATGTWTNLDATLGNASLIGVSDVTATIYNAAVKIISEAAGFVIGGTAALVEVAASATLTVNNNVLIAGTVRLVLTDVTGVDDGTATVNGSLFAFTITSAKIFGGVDAVIDASVPATPTVTTTNATGFYAENIGATLAVLSTANGTFTGLTLSVGSGEIVGIPDTTASVGNFAVIYNDGVDWTQTPLAAAGLTLSGTVFEIETQATLTVNNNVLLAATFALSITTPAAGESLLTISVLNAFAFAGNGTVTATRNANGDVTALTVGDGAQGFVATGVTFEFASYSTATAGYAAIYLSAATVSPEGIDGLTLNLSDLLVRANFDNGAGAFDWAASTLTLTSVANIAAYDATERLDVQVTIDELNIDDALLLTGTITLTTAKGVLIDGVTGDLLYLSLSNLSVFAGQGATITGGVLNADDGQGFLAAGGSFAIGILTDITNPAAPVQYTGIKGALDTVTVKGLSAVTVELTGFAFDYNATTGTDKISWAAATDAPALSTITDQTTIAVTGSLLLAIETNFIATADFSLISKTQDVNDTSIALTGASVLIFELTEASVWAGTGFVLEGTTGDRSVNEANATGFTVQLATIEFVVVNEMTTGPPAPRSWSAVYGELGTVTPVGLPSDLTFTLKNVTFGMNNAAADGTKIDWTALDGAAAGQITDLPTNIATFDNLYGIAFGGSVEIAVSGSVLVAGTLSGRISDGVLNDGAAYTDDRAISVFTFTVSGGFLFAGVGGDFTRDADGAVTGVDVANATGLSATGVAIEIVTVTETLVPTNKWSAFDIQAATVTAAGLSSLAGVGIELFDFEASGNSTAILNGTNIDWTGVTDAAFSDLTRIKLLDAAVSLSIGGGIDLNVADSVLATGRFTLLALTKDLNDEVTPITGADILIFTLSDVEFFAGVGGAFAGSGSLTNGTKDSIDPAAGTGFYASGASLELVIVNDKTALQTYSAVALDVQTVSLIGLPDALQFQITDLFFGANNANAAVDPVKLDWTELVDELGADLPSTIATFDAGYGLEFAATLELIIDTDKVLVKGSLAGAIFNTDIDAGDVQITGADVFSFSVTNASLFAGSGGAFDAGTASGFADGGTGFTATNVSLELLTISGGTVTAGGATGDSWTAYRITVDQASPVGIDGITLKAYNFVVAGNSVTDAAVTVDLPSKIDWTLLSAELPGFAITDSAQGLTDAVVFEIGGAVEVDISGFVLGLGRFSLEINDYTNVTDDTLVIGDAQVLTISLSGISLFAGVGGTFNFDADSGRALSVNSTNGTGFVVNNASLDIVLLKDLDATIANIVTYTAVSVTADGVGLQGLPSSLVFDITDFSFNMNLPESGQNVAVNSQTRLNWATVKFGTTPEALPLPASIAALESGDSIAFGGNLRLEITGGVLIAGTLGGSIKSGTITDGTTSVTDADIFILKVTDTFIFAGVGGQFDEDADGKVTGITAGVGTGFFGSDVNVEIVSVSEPVPAVATTTPLVTRTAVNVYVGALGVRGLDIPNFDAKVFDFVVKGNFVSDTTEAKFDWDTDNAGSNIDTLIALDGTSLDLTDATSDGAIDILVGITIGGFIQLDLFGSVLAYGQFTISSSIQNVADGNRTIAGAQVLTVSVSDVNLFAGVGGQFTLDGDDKATAIDPDAGTGFRATGANLDLAIITQTVDNVLTTTVETRELLRWTAVAVEVEQVTLQNFPDALVIEVNDLAVKLNVAATPLVGPEIKLDWSSVSQVSGTMLADIDASIGVLFSGAMEIQIDTVVLLSGAFAGSVKNLAALDGGTANTAAMTDVSILTFSLRDVYLFAGTGGAFTRDGDGAVNGIANQGTGFKVENLALDLALVSETATSAGVDALTPARSWTALYATTSAIAPVGLPSGLEIAVTRLTIGFNGKDARNSEQLDWANIAETQNLTVSVLIAGTDLIVSGALTLNAFGFVSLSATFDLVSVSALTAELDSSLAGKEDATALLIGLTISDLFIGQPNGVGISVSSGSLALALLKTTPPTIGTGPTATVGPYAATTTPGATAIFGTLTGATINGLPEGLDFTITSVTVNLYQTTATSTVDAGTGAFVTNPFDWTSIEGPVDFVPTADAGLSFTFGETGSEITAVFDATSDRLNATGSLALNAFGFVIVNGGFTFAKDTVDVDVNSDGTFDTTLGDMNNAVLTRLSISAASPDSGTTPGLFIGLPDGPGISVETAEVVFASLKAADPLTDGRGYSTLKAEIAGASLTGIDPITVDLDALVLELNSAKNALVPTATVDVLDWGNSINLDPTAWASGDTGITGQDTFDAISADGDTPDGTLRPLIDSSINGFKVFADATIVVSEFVFITGKVAISQQNGIAAREVGSTAAFTTSVLSIGISDAVVFAGVGWADGDTLATTEGTGIGLTVDSLGLFIVKEVNAAKPVTELRKWTSLKASGGAELIGVDDVILKGDLDLVVNQAGAINNVAYKTLDFTFGGGDDGWTIQVGNSDPIVFDSVVAEIVVTGSVVIGIDQYVFISGEFSFRQSDEIYTVITDQVATSIFVNGLTLGASNVNIFVGTGYDLDLDFAAQDDLVGLKISNGLVGLALFKEVTSATDKTAKLNGQSFTALTASGDVELVGVEGLTLAAYNLQVLVNKGSGTAAIDFTKGDFDTNPFNLTAGTEQITFDMTTGLIQASGFVVIGIEQYVYLAGNISFAQGGTLTTSTSTKKFDVTKVTGSGISAFVGTGGPYWDVDLGDPADPQVVERADAGNATGVIVDNFSFTLALIGEVRDVAATATTPAQRVAVTNGLKYSALYATISSVEVVGVDGVVLAANNLELKVNTASGGLVPPATTPVPTGLDFTTVTGLDPGLQIFVVESFAGTLLELRAGNGAGNGAQIWINLDGTTPATADAADFVLQGDLLYEKTTSANGQVFTKIALTTMTVQIGDFAVTGDALMYLTATGLAGSFEVTVDLSTTAGGNAISVGGTIRLEISTRPTATNIGFDTTNDGDPDTFLDLPRGKFVRLTGEDLFLSVDLGNDDSEELRFSGSISVTQVSPLNNAAGPKKTIIAFTGVTGTFVDESNVIFDITEGAGVFIFYSDTANPTSTANGIAGLMELTLGLRAGAFETGATAQIRINTTSRTAINETVEIAGATYTITFTEANVRTIALIAAKLSFDPYFTIEGSVAQLSASQLQLANASATSGFVGRNISIFIGDRGVLDDDSDDIGLLITNTQLAVWEFGTGTTRSFAIYATGTVTVVGIEGLTIEGTVTVRINKSGQLIAPHTIQDIRLDNNDALPDLQVAAVAGQIEQVSADALTFGFGGTGTTNIVAITAGGEIGNPIDDVVFTRMPGGSIEVDIPQAAITVTPPDADSFGIEGAARFSFGGALGFQLQDMRVTGYTLFGETVELLRTTGFRPVTADIAAPLQNQIVSLADLNYIDVIYNDINRSATAANPSGMNLSSITDAGAEFVLTVRSLTAPSTPITLLVSGEGELVEGTSRPTFRYEILSKPLTLDQTVTVEVQFLANSWEDARGAQGAAKTVSFRLLATTPPTGGSFDLGNPQPIAYVASPFNGSGISVDQINAKGYIDITFLAEAGKELIGIDGDEIRILSQGGAINLDPALNGVGEKFTVVQISKTTYRFFVAAKPTTGTNPTAAATTQAIAPANPAFVAGEVVVEFIAGTWGNQKADGSERVVFGAETLATTFQGLTNQKVVFTNVFTVTAAPMAQSPSDTALKIGPITIDKPTFGLDKLAFKDGLLVLTLALGADTAAFSFGGGASGSGGSGTQTDNSGVSITLTNLLIKFDIAVDILGVISGEGFELSPTGKWSISADRLQAIVPNAFELDARLITIQYDPNADESSYDANRPTGAGQTLVRINTVEISFPSFGISGYLTQDNSGGETIPGLTVYDNGFRIGEGVLIYTPGASGNTATPTSGTSGDKIRLGSILEFDDFRIGVSNFSYISGNGVTFDGTIFVASGGAKFFPGKAINATVIDRLSAEPGEAPGVPNTEALRAGLTFTDGKVDGFIFELDTFVINIGPYLTIKGVDLRLDTSAADDEELISFAAIGAEVQVGSLRIGGEARQFAFLGDGTFVTKQGFGVFLSVGSVDGASFKWPSWLPIKITEIGILWPDIQEDPTDFILILSASIRGISGADGLQFEGAVNGIRIDVGLLLEGKFPVIGIDSLGVSVSGTLFGGSIDGALIGGIVRLDANGNQISTFDFTTPVADRLLFVGVEASFGVAGVSGFTIRFAFSELGPLGVLVSGSVPGGILLEPNSGLAINDFTGGVDFFKSLPDITDAADLAGPAFALPGTITVDQWLESVESQVVAQYKAVQANPSLGGFLAAFTAPMTIYGSAKVFSIYTSEKVFNGQVAIKISTDGKILVIGQLNFAADNLSLSARLYANLSKIAQGEGTILLLVKVPDQLDLLTVKGSLQFGFRDILGEETQFAVTYDSLDKPYQALSGITQGTVYGVGSFNNVGYIIVDFSEALGTLNTASITDLEAEIVLLNTTATLNTSIGAIETETAGQYQIWLSNLDASITNVEYGFVYQSWSFTDTTTNETVYSDRGKVSNPGDPI
ncbi:LEPR-XLL domain-containing protein, partial [Yoonia litorea]